MKGQYIPDNDLLLAEAQTVSTDAAGNIGAGYIDLGAGYADFPSVLGVFNVGTTDFGNADETYSYKIQFSNLTDFSALEGEFYKTVSSAAEVESNNSTVLVSATAAGRYARAYIDVSGTSPSTVIDLAFLTKE